MFRTFALAEPFSWKVCSENIYMAAPSFHSDLFTQKPLSQQGLPWPSCLKYQHLTDTSLCLVYFSFALGEQGFLYALFTIQART